jgi:hypothetical protein
MIIGKKSFVKGGLLFIGIAAIATCIVATFATEESVLQAIAGIALVATLVGAITLFDLFKNN